MRLSLFFIGFLLFSLPLPAQGPVLVGELTQRSAAGRDPVEYVDVYIAESGKRVSTIEDGAFRLPLDPIFREGEEVTLRVALEGWEIYRPPLGKLRIPADSRKELIEVELRPKGSRDFFDSDQMLALVEQGIQEAKKQVAQLVQQGVEQPKPDLSPVLREWAVQYGFRPGDVRRELDRWAAEIGERDATLRERAAAAFAVENFSEAGRLYRDSGQRAQDRMEAAEQEARRQREDAIADYRRSGDAYFADYAFEEAAASYQQAAGLIDQSVDPTGWTSIRINLGNALREAGIRISANQTHVLLEKAANAYREVADASRESSPQEWAAGQVGLGTALQDQGVRTAGEAGAALLAEAGAAYRAALTVRTREHLPYYWAQTTTNLAQAAYALQDWPTAAESYAGLLDLYPQYREALDRASWLYHEVLFDYPHAFAINAAWLEHNPADDSILADFAEKHLTTARFAACIPKTDAAVGLESQTDSTRIVMHAIAAACRLGAGQPAKAKARLAAARKLAAAQPDDFQLGWRFSGAKHFVATHPAMEPRRPLLTDLFANLEQASREETLAALDQALRKLQQPAGKITTEAGAP